MLDRLISGAGSLTDLADRFARTFSRRSGGDPLGRRPGSVAVTVLLLVLSAVLVIVGFEATDDPVARTIAPAVGDGEGIGNRAYATISGSVSSQYVETYADANGDEIQEADEASVSWFYFLVDPATRTGVTVRSTRPTSDVFRVEATGTVVEDPDGIAADAAYFEDSVKELGITLDRRRLVDASVGGGPSPAAVDLAAGLPADGAGVTIAGARTAAWAPTCSVDRDDDGYCDDDELDAFEVVVYDPVTKRGVLVVTPESPEFTPATFTGMLRRDERAVSEAQTTEGLGFDDLDIAVSDHYVLDDGRAPASALLTFGIAAVCGLLAAIILIGLAGGYLIYRRDGTPPAAPASALPIDGRIPLRVTGLLRAAGGYIHVREAPADLVRFQTAGTEAASTLIVERRDRPEGVAVGLGELTRLSVGSVFPLRGRRPAVRAVAGTGPLLLSFDTEADRDRAAAELLAEARLDRPPTADPGPQTVTEET